MERHVAGTTWADDVAAAWLGLLAADPSLRMCLATGSTPLPVYERMAHAPGAFADSAILLLDEFGGLPPGDPASCDAVLRSSLVDAVAPADYRTIDTAAADVECPAIDSWIDGGGGIDLAILGLGRNGHVGMNEPGAPIDGRTARVALAASTIDGAQRYFEGRARPTWGVTVGLRDLLAAGEVWVLATGEDKAAIVARSADGPVTPDVPASLLQHHPNCTWWLDHAAAPTT